VEDWKKYHKGICAKLQKVNAYDRAKGHTLVDASRETELNYYVSEEVFSL
jgi:hypothetical protein